MAVNPAVVAWVLMSTALFMLMTPTLSFFYGVGISVGAVC
jgi:ammonia channel protein AmtB